MKKFVTILAGVVLAASLTTAAYAQAAGPTGGGVQSGGAAPGQKKQGKAHAPVAQKMLKELNLTPDQMKQVKDLVKTYQDKQKDAQNAQTTGKVKRGERAQMVKQFMDDLNKILTPDQQTKLKQLQEEAKEKRKNKLNGGAGTTGGATTGGSTTGTSKTGGGGSTGGGN